MILDIIGNVKTLNDIGALCRAMPEEHARRMLDRLMGVFAL